MSDGRYLELTVSVDPADAERAADLLGVLTDQGVAIEMPFSQPTLEDGAIPRPGVPAVLRVYLNGASDHAMLPGEVRDALERAGIEGDASLSRVDEQDWAHAWKEHFRVERFGRIVVVPSWREYRASSGDVVLTLDPGMAFGTGQHETTRMCLEALDRHVRPGARVLDAGCGSGILGIAAARLGAADVLATDVDADCLRIARENAGANGVALRTRLVQPDDHGWADGECADIAVANILAGPIIDLAPVFARVLVPGGRLIASGIIAAREGEVLAALKRAGLHVESRRALGEWRCVEAARPQRLS